MSNNLAGFLILWRCRRNVRIPWMNSRFICLKAPPIWLKPLVIPSRRFCPASRSRAEPSILLCLDKFLHPPSYFLGASYQISSWWTKVIRDARIMASLPPSPRGVTTIAVITIVSALSTLFALARFWVHIKIKRKFAFDDFLILVSVVSSPQSTLVCQYAQTRSAQWLAERRVLRRRRGLGRRLARRGARDKADRRCDPIHVARLRSWHPVILPTQDRDRVSTVEALEPLPSSSLLALVHIRLQPDPPFDLYRSGIRSMHTIAISMGLLRPSHVLLGQVGHC